MNDVAEGIRRLKTPVFMGIVNVTPDSFSDGGRFLDPRRAIERGRTLIAEGAAIIDIGGESTRPGAAPVTAQEETDRILPVIEGLKNCGATISVDTRRAATMKAALAAGAGMINDITALRGDPDSLGIAAAASGDVAVCLMHMRGEPATMQENPVYGDVVEEVLSFLGSRIAVCEAGGISRTRLIADPGIGFGKTLDHNLALLKNIEKFSALGVPVMIGVSRKSMVEKIGGAAGGRVPGSIVAALWAWRQGASIFRVHDVAETRQAFAVHQAILSSV